MLEQRAVFVTIPPLLSDIITEVVREDVRLNVVAQFSERDAFSQHLPALAPDLVLIGLRNGETDEIGASVANLIPTAKVLVLSSNGDCAYLHEVRGRRTVLQSFSLRHLLAALVGPESSPQG